MYERNDPLTSFRYRVRFLGEKEDIAGFSSISGLEMKIETESYQEGGSDRLLHLPKSVSYTNAVFKKGACDKKLLNWYKSVLDSVYTKSILPFKDIVILIYDSTPSNDVKPRIQLILEDAVPVKWSLSELNATGNNILFETIEIAFRSIRYE
jgi:phage tail-like protein